MDVHPFRFAPDFVAAEEANASPASRSALAQGSSAASTSGTAGDDLLAELEREQGLQGAAKYLVENIGDIQDSVETYSTAIHNLMPSFPVVCAPTTGDVVLGIAALLTYLGQRGG